MASSEGVMLVGKVNPVVVEANKEEGIGTVLVGNPSKLFVWKNKRTFGKTNEYKPV